MKLSIEEREPIVKECLGCIRVDKMILEGEETDVCKVYLFPLSKWRAGKCPMFIRPETKRELEEKKRVLRGGKKKRR